jgi:hypothetical protein
MSPQKLPPPPLRQRFRRALLAWYRAHGRDLPWRRTDDPYHILVSEIMLQQTQVDRVLPKYHEWLAKYPSLEALASAPEDQVAETWRPLGYNIRPRRLQSIARESMSRYGGQLPSDADALLAFKGIGAYTAGAIRSFAFGQRARDRRHQHRAGPSARVSRPRQRQGSRDAQAPLGCVRSARSAEACIRFQPGAHGSRRHDLRGPQAEMPRLSDDESVPHVRPAHTSWKLIFTTSFCS